MEGNIVNQVKTLAKGERLPKHKYKQYWAMSGLYHEYMLYDQDEKLIAKLYKPRWQHMPRKLEVMK
jgi:uncharacterized protein YxjI